MYSIYPYRIKQVSRHEFLVVDQNNIVIVGASKTWSIALACAFDTIEYDKREKHLWQ